MTNGWCTCRYRTVGFEKGDGCFAEVFSGRHSKSSEFREQRPKKKRGKEMKLASTFMKVCLVLGVAVCLLPSLTLAQHYTQTNLVSNKGSAALTDPNLQNPWGLVASPT